MAFWNSMGEPKGHPLPGHGMLEPVARVTPAPRVLLARSLLSQLTDSLLRRRRGASVCSFLKGNKQRFAAISDPNPGVSVQGQRKRPGGAADSGPARKRSRLQPSSAGGTSQAEPAEPVESGTPALEPEVIDLTGEEEVIDLTGESSEPEVIIISDDESVVESEQSQQQPHLSMASENSAEPLERDEEPRDTDDDWLLYDFDLPYWSDEDSEDRVQSQQQPHVPSPAENSAEPLERDDEAPGDTDDDWLLYDFDLPYWSDEDSEDRVQNQQQPHVSSAAENSAESLARDDEEEPRDVDGAWPAGPATPPTGEDEHSEDSDSVDWGPPHFFRRAENSAEVPARDAEEQPRDHQGRWPESVYVARFWMHYYSDWWDLRRQPQFVTAEDNSAVLVMGNSGEDEEDDNNAQPSGTASPPATEDEDSELLEGHEEERSNITVNSHNQVDGSGSERGANEAPVAASAPAEQGAEEEDTQSSDSVPLPAQQGVVIRCPICMDCYSEITRHGRHLMSTTCGHVFCSRCLPVALQTARTCPTCREHLSPAMCHPIYL